ncbi:hypothetical protein DIC66_03705 [Rhodoferax lacus]|uniref:Uncharacterized protein n=2 Tax=Rhodoferax lacus TaxID=2184758 RepID=A0A3E1REQ3_9BURK|nr:hypothetical protein DIC66_03705 [Rhodoferax lacus]
MGRDSTTKRAKLLQKALSGKANMARITANGGTVSDIEAYAVESAALLSMDETQGGILVGAGGEAMSQDDPGLLDTMKTPGVAAMDASRDRLRLVSQVGVDCAASALDASDSIQAANSLERMLSHQLAVCHTTAMNYVAKANLQQDPQNSVRMMNLGIRAMETFQRGLMTVKRMRGSGEQRITIQHVNVTGGGQAVIGQVQPRGGAGEK